MDGTFALSGPKPQLSQRAKAAIIVRLLSREEVTLPLDRFTEEHQVALAHELSALSMIDKDTLGTVVDEFIEELNAVGISFPGGMESALGDLEGAISDSTMSKLRSNAGFSLTRDPWERISNTDETLLLSLLEAESVEVCAVTLSKLATAKAAALMSQLPGERARKVAYAVSQTSNVSPDVVNQIGQAIAAQLDSIPPVAFSDGPPVRVGAILNFSSSRTRDGVLEGLDETDKDFADEVRKNIFTFANIATRIDGRDVAKVVRVVEQDTLLKALKAATGDDELSANFILENMSKRMAEGLREEMSELAEVPETEAEEAMGAIVASVRELEEAGDIVFLKGEG